MAVASHQLINWHDRLTAPSLKDALRKFKGIVVGGVEERNLLVSGAPEAVRAQVRDAIAQTGGRRLMVGPGCVAGAAWVVGPGCVVESAATMACAAGARTSRGTTPAARTSTE